MILGRHPRPHRWIRGAEYRLVVVPVDAIGMEVLVQFLALHCVPSRNGLSVYVPLSIIGKLHGMNFVAAVPQLFPRTFWAVLATPVIVAPVIG